MTQEILVPNLVSVIDCVWNITRFDTGLSCQVKTWPEGLSRLELRQGGTKIQSLLRPEGPRTDLYLIRIPVLFIEKWLPPWCWGNMTMSSNGNIFRVTGPLCGEFTSHRWIPLTQRPATQSLDVFFDLPLNKRLSKQPRRRWFETPSRSLSRHCNELHCCYGLIAKGNKGMSIMRAKIPVLFN